jgi:outer membrane lipoprotein-sorting protein
MDNEIKKLLKDNLLKTPSKDFTAQTMQKIHEVHEGHQVKRKINRWFILSPLAAAAVSGLFLIFFWPWGSPGTISWADVQKQLEQVHTMTAKARYELTIQSWKQTWGYMKVYVKDPGLRRCEIYDTEDDLKTIKPEPQWISIFRSERGMSKGLTLHPDSHWAEMWTGISHTYGTEPSTQVLKISSEQNINHALEIWDKMKIVTEDKTKRIGSQLINGKLTVGFSFEIPAKELGLGEWSPAIIPGKIWVDCNDGTPMLSELEYKTGHGDHTVHFVYSDIQWNVPIDDKLFDLTPPTDWHISNHLNDSIEYTNVSIKPNVTLVIGPEGQEPLSTTMDVIRLVKTERSTDPNVDLGCTGLITIELTPAASKRVHDYAEAHPDIPIFVNFNGQIKAAAKLDMAHPTHLSFDISPLRLSMFKVEEKYANTIAAVELDKP